MEKFATDVKEWYVGVRSSALALPRSYLNFFVLFFETPAGHAGDGGFQEGRVGRRSAHTVVSPAGGGPARVAGQGRGNGLDQRGPGKGAPTH
jgi:hypothetical protein